MTQAESPEWIPASSMCCMMPPMKVTPITKAIDVDLDRRFEEFVDRNRLIRRSFYRPRDIGELLRRRRFP